MLLVLAPRSDETARRLAARAALLGIPCAHVDRFRDLSLSASCERDGAVTVRLLLRNGQVPVTAVFNRGVPNAEGDVGSFAQAEIVAACWTALACLPGPVINRPSRLGYMPSVEPTLLAATGVCNYESRAGTLATVRSPRVSDGHGAVSLHRLRDGAFLGHMAQWQSDLESELVVGTPFDPEMTRHLLVVGRRTFDLSRADGSLEGTAAAKVAPLVAEMRGRHATFALAVVESSNDVSVRLLSTTVFPTFRHFSHVEENVYDALLEFLS